MKKYIALTVALISLLTVFFVPEVSCVTALSAERTEIAASKYTSKHPSLTLDGGIYAAFNTSDVWLEYTVYSETDGDFYLYLLAGLVRTSDVSVLVNGRDLYTRNMGATTSASIRREILLEKIMLSKGNNTIRIQGVADKLYLEKLIIEKNPPIVKDDGETNILARAYTDCYEGLLFEKGNIVINSNSQWVEYTVMAEKSGIYEFYLSAGTVFSVAQIYLVTNGTVNEPKVLLNTTTYDNLTYQLIQKVVLKEGVNTIRVCLGKAGLYMGDIIIKPYEAESLTIVPKNGEISLDGATCSSTEGTQDGKKLLLAENESVVYNIQAVREGNVRLGITLSEGSSDVELCLNETDKMILTPNEDGVINETVYMFEGSNIITLTAKGGSATIEKISFFTKGQAFNGEEVKILSYNYNDSSGNIIRETNHLSFRANHWTEYYLNVEKQGTYMLYIGVSTIYNNDTDVEILLNGKEKTIAVLEATNNIGFTADRFAARVTLSKGFNTLRITNLSAGMYFDYIKLTEKKEALSNLERIEAESFLYGYNPKVSQIVSGVSLLDSYWLKYNVDVPKSGLYRITLCGVSDTDTTVYVSQDNRLLGNISLRKTEQEGNHTGFVELKAGESVLKLTLSKGKVDLSHFSLTETENREKDFLEDIEKAQNYEDIDGVFKKYENFTGVSLPEITEGIFCKTFIYENILNGSFASASDVLYKLYKDVDLENTRPAISVLKGEKIINSLGSGAEYIVIDKARFNNKKTLICAIYQGNKLHFLYTVSGYGDEKETVNIKNCGLDFTKPMDFKVMEFDSFDKMHPLEWAEKTRLSLYVSPSGDDSKSGTEEEPLKTLKKAKEKAKELAEGTYGDVVINLFSGTHYISETEIFSESDSGKNGFNLIIRGTDDKNPSVISGGRVVTGFKEDKNGIWKAPFTYSGIIRNLYINNQPAIRAKSSEMSVKAIYDDALVETSLDGIVTDSSVVSNIVKPADSEIVVNTHWAQHRIPVSGIKVQTGAKAIVFDEEVLSDVNKLSGYLEISAGTKFYLENDLSFLDEENEFYYDRNAQMLYYKPNSTTDMETVSVVVPLVEDLIKIEGSNERKAKNIIFENVTFAHSAYAEATKDGLINRQADYFYKDDTESSKMRGQITIKNAEGIQFKNCIFTCLGSAAVDIYDGVSNVLIEGNLFKNIAGGGVIVGSIELAKSSTTEKICTDIEISNNVFRNIGFEYFCQTAVSVYYANTISITHNDMKNMPYLGISLGWGWGDENVRTCGGIEVSNNRIVSVMEKLYDGGHIYTLGPLRDTLITENYMESSTCSQFGGVYTDQGSGYMHITDNVIIDCQNWFFTGLNKTHDLYVSGNMSDSASYIKRGEDNYYEDAVDLRRGWTDEATRIYEESGLEENFSSILNYQ